MTTKDSLHKKCVRDIIRVDQLIGAAMRLGWGGAAKISQFLKNLAFFSVYGIGLSGDQKLAP